MSWKCTATHSTLCAHHSLVLSCLQFGSFVVRWIKNCRDNSIFSLVLVPLPFILFGAALFSVECNRVEWSLVALLREWHERHSKSQHRYSTPTLDINATPRRNLSLTPRPETYFCLDRPRPSFNGRSPTPRWHLRWGNQVTLPNIKEGNKQ